MEWFEKWFASPLYLQLYANRNDAEAKILIDLIQRNVPLIPNKSKVLDVCCGAGRHSVEFAKRGFEVTGFDLSKYLISVAKKSFASEDEKSLKAKFLNKDMRCFNFNNQFNLAVNIFTSFGYFETEEENFLVFKNISNSLRKAGYFVFDYFNSNYLTKTINPYTKTQINKKILIQKRSIVNGFINKDIYIDTDKKRPDFTERLKLFSRNELRSALENNKLKVVNEYGDYFGNKFNINKSSRIILIAQKI